jgi:hypothetical protein
VQAMVTADPSNTTTLYKMSAIYTADGFYAAMTKNIRGSIQDFESAAETRRQLSERDPGNTNYRALPGELLARVGNLLHSLGEDREAMEKTAAGLEMMKTLASAA